MEKVELPNVKKTVEISENGNADKTRISSDKNQDCRSNVVDKLFKTFYFKVNKPLIPLKITLFCWFAAAAVLKPFIGLYLKQLGLTLKNLSIIYIIMPFSQFMGSAVSGIIADKIGRSKPVLLANLFLVIVGTNCMLLIPGLMSDCNREQIICHSKVTENTTTISYCYIQKNGYDLFKCRFQCSHHGQHQLKDICFQNYISSCGLLSQHNSSWHINSSAYETHDTCVKELKTDSSDFVCPNHRVKDCNPTCEEILNVAEKNVPCKSTEGQTQLFVLSFIVSISYSIFFSNCYRIIDVTAMSMIKSYNSDFGRQRVWSILGVLIFSPLSGYIIGLVSPNTGPQKYETAFYFFDAMTLLTMAAVWKLDVTVESPAKEMLKKTRGLLKNSDVVAFLIAVFVIGTTWGFAIVFSNWYLEELKAPSLLIGLIPAVNGIVGLPFLFSSKWFVAKIGSANLLILAMLGYVALCTGYSFLQNPWWSLIYEVFGVLTYHLLWVTVVTHCHDIAPPGLSATAVSVAGGIHFGIGIGSGSLIGGVIMSKYGGRTAYRVMAALCFGSSVLYASYLSLKRRITKKELDLRKIGIGKTGNHGSEEKFTPHMMF